MPFYWLTDFQMIWETESGKQHILNMMENNGFKEFMSNSVSLQESNLNMENIRYFDIDELNQRTSENKMMKVMHFNCRMLAKNRGKIKGFLYTLEEEPDIILLSEIGKDGHRYLKSTFPNYTAEFVLPKCSSYGGVAILALDNTYEMTVNTDLNITKACNCAKCQIEDIWLDITCEGKKFTVVAIYRHPNGNIEHFTQQLALSLHKVPTDNICLIGGDININLMDITKDLVLNYVTLFMSLGFVPKIYLPTRITDHTCTLIDHIFLRLPKKYHEIYTYSGCIFSDISDHLPIILAISFINRPSAKRPYVRIINERTLNNFKVKCENHNWAVMDNLDDIDDKYDFLESSITDNFEESFPLVKQSRKRNKDKKWMTSGLLKSIRHKHRLYKKKIVSPTVHNKLSYTRFESILQSTLKEAEQKYFYNLFNDVKDSSVKLWKCLGNMINPNKKVKRNRISKLNVNGVDITDDQLISNQMNEYFCNIGKKLANDLPQSGDFTKYLMNKVNATMFLSPVLRTEITKVIDHLNSKKSPGPDNMSPKILKYCGNALSEPLSKIFNSSIEAAKYPTKLKIAKVIALHKKNCYYQPENYRPISLLSCIDKIFEKIIHTRLMNFIDKHNIIILQQFGFLPKHSTIQALIEVVDNIRRNIDKGEYTLGIYLDLKEAFDTVNHEILLKK